MATKESEQRKRSNDYRKEYEEVCLKQLALENRIARRTLSLCKEYPEVMIPLIVEDGIKRGGYSVAEFYDGVKVKGMSADTQDCLDVMKAIEDHIDSLHPHKQMNLYKDV